MKLNRSTKALWLWVTVATVGGQAAIQAASPVVINEILADNVSFTDMSENTPDWVEFYNPSDQEVSLLGLYLTTSMTDPHRWDFKRETTIAARGRLVIYCDDQSVAGSINTGFGLNAGGDTLYLVDSATNVVDSITFGMQVADYSIGRLPDGSTTWGLCQPSPKAANEAAVLGNAANLKLNEWMAAPASGDDWLEIYNPESAPVLLGGLYLTVDSSKPTASPIPALSYIGTGAKAYERFYASKNPTNGPNHTTFKLSKDGSFLGLASASGYIDRLTYPAQTTGVSQGRLPDGGGQFMFFRDTASPAESNYLPLGNVLINEILTHTDPPQEDSIELYNASDAEVSLQGWFLSDSPANWKKYAIPAGTKIAPRGYLLFTASQFNAAAAATPFSLDSAEGDSVYLCQGDASGNLTGYRSDAKFGAAPNGVSFGRYTNSVGKVDFPAQSELTLGTLNSGPLVGPVVVSEIMYHPSEAIAGEDNTLDEYIELLNISPYATPLYIVDEPTNTWRLRSAVSFDLPQGITLAAGGRLLVVNFNPSKATNQLAAFRSKFNVPATVPVLGPYEGKLSNADDRVSLQKPDPVQGAEHVNEGFVPYVLVDSVHYADAYPWPTAADGLGSALQRLNPKAYADDPANWTAAAPLPGRAKGGTSSDTDADGMPDEWETAQSLNPNDASDANADADNDGMTNLQEYLAGTDPRSAGSRLGFDSVKGVSGAIQLTFTSVAGKTYVVQCRDSMTDGSWIAYQEVVAPTNGGAVTVLDRNLPSAGTRYYRLTLK